MQDGEMSNQSTVTHAQRLENAHSHIEAGPVCNITSDKHRCFLSSKLARKNADWSERRKRGNFNKQDYLLGWEGEVAKST